MKVRELLRKQIEPDHFLSLVTAYSTDSDITVKMSCSCRWETELVLTRSTFFIEDYSPYIGLWISYEWQSHLLDQELEP